MTALLPNEVRADDEPLHKALPYHRPRHAVVPGYGGNAVQTNVRAMLWPSWISGTALPKKGADGAQPSTPEINALSGCEFAERYFATVSSAMVHLVRNLSLTPYVAGIPT